MPEPEPSANPTANDVNATLEAAEIKARQYDAMGSPACAANVRALAALVRQLHASQGIQIAPGSIRTTVDMVNLRRLGELTDTPTRDPDKVLAAAIRALEAKG